MSIQQCHQEIVVVREGDSVSMPVNEYMQLTVVVGEEGYDSYVEHEMPNGEICRMFTLKGGGAIDIKTGRE